MATTFATDASQTPVYQEYPWSDAWGCADWINWYNALVAANGSDSATAQWTGAWLDGLSVAAGGNGVAPGSGYILDSVPLSCRTFDSSFQTFLDGNPNLKSVVFSGLAGVIIKPISTITETASNVENIISNTGLAASNTSATLSKILPYVAVALVIIVILVILKKQGLIKLGV
jgi:hypothetical protein